MRQITRLAAVLASFLLAAAAPAQPPSPVQVSVSTDVEAVAPGERFVIAVVMDHDEHFHSWPSADQDVLPPEIAALALRTELSITGEGLPIVAGDVQWPEPELAPVPNLDPNGDGGSVMVPTYKDRAISYIPVQVQDDAPEGELIIPISLFFQACDDTTCYMPESHDLSVTVTVSRGPIDTAARTTTDFRDFDATAFEALSEERPSAPAPAPEAPEPEGTNAATFFGLNVTGGLLLLALFGLIGGFVLNLTPCVLPVIPIKIMTLSQHAGESRLRTLFLGVWMALGVIAFWLALGVPVAFINGVSDPSRIFGVWWVTLSIGLIIGVMGVGIMGAFTFQLPQKVYMVNPKADSAWGSFVFGVMTAVLGLPCFGFVAGALVPAALTQGPMVVLTLFTSMGVGMASPYLLLSAFPGLIEKLPRTGPASELVKQVMGLLLIAAAVYFIGAGVFALLKSDPVRAASLPWWAKTIHWWLIALCGLGAGGWLVFRTFQISSKTLPRLTFAMIALLLTGGGIVLGVNRTNKAMHDFWLPYEPATLAEAVDSGKVVVIDFTADWCINCQVLKATILDRDPVKGELRSEGVVPLIADLTSTKAPGWGRLSELGRTGIPTLAIYGPGLDEPWVSNAYTSDQVLKALADARGDVARVP